MDYRVDFGFWGSIFAMPTSIVDKHLKLCSESQLKVLLLVFRDAPNAIDVQYVAKRLGLTPTQVDDALEYWKQAGVFDSNEAATAVQPTVAARPEAVPDRSVTTTEQSADGQRITTVHSRGKLTPSQINLMSKDDPNVPWLLEQLQQRLARPLSPAEVETVAYLYSYFGLTPDYLLMAVEYCKVMGKTNMRYIEKLVTGWVDAGVDTHDKAERHICELGKRCSNEGLVKTMFGIGSRELSANEKKYINIWFSDYCFDTELIKLAYDRTVDNTGEVAFPYLHKILTKWHSSGISTAAQAMQEMSSRKASSSYDNTASFDLGDIEKLMKLNTSEVTV